MDNTIYNWKDIGVNEMTNLYLFGQKTTSANKVDGSLVRPRGATSRVDIDANDFMQNGAGRFTVGADSMVVRRFIEANNDNYLATIAKIS